MMTNYIKGCGRPEKHNPAYRCYYTGWPGKCSNRIRPDPQSRGCDFAGEQKRSEQDRHEIPRTVYFCAYIHRCKASKSTSIREAYINSVNCRVLKAQLSPSPLIIPLFHRWFSQFLMDISRGS